MIKIKIKELMKILSKYPSDYEIILSKDEEGNAYNPLYSIEEGYFENSEFHSKDHFDEEFDNEDYECNCVTLFP
jgi:hypothetical protein